MLITPRLFRTLNKVRSSYCIHGNIVISRKASSIPNHGHEVGGKNIPTDFSAWTKEQVTSWLSNVQSLDENNKQVWASLQVTGKSLCGISQEVLEKHGMPYGPAFEIVSHIRKLLGPGQPVEPIVICTECRFSAPTANTYISKRKVQKKCELTVEQFRPYFAKGAQLDGFTLKEDNLFLVVCAFRNVRKDALTDKELPKNTIILNRDRLKALYTPSLASRPQFMLPLKHGELTQVPE
eukprot:Phypoly_transcript_13585.p1 GENE.Phypoly_transcript_13585~~Phypoly_transcript_13585.p1  ORF type:complete len:237 (+),score=19.20 Phypoly_transcript_13585:123-833(+)